MSGHETVYLLQCPWKSHPVQITQLSAELRNIDTGITFICNGYIITWPTELHFRTVSNSIICSRSH